MLLKPAYEFSIKNKQHYKNIEKIGKGISSILRIKILDQIYDAPRTITELAKINGITTSTVIFHTNLLLEANLIQMRYEPSKKGKTQFFFIGPTSISINYKKSEELIEKKYIQSMPIGNYTDANFFDYVRFATINEMYRIENNDIFNSLRNQAELIWTGGGKLVYSFSNQFASAQKIKELNFTLEICSETIGYKNDWKSDITFSVNDKEILTYTSPGDYGGKMGKLNPEWWSPYFTQYGDLVSISINDTGVYLNNQFISKKVTLRDLNLNKGNKILFSIETKKDAEHRGGFNLFGKSFGNYQQDIILTAFFY